MTLVKAGDAAKIFFHCVDATDLSTPETGEASGQPQISVDGGSWGNTTNTLVAIGNGRYYVIITGAETTAAGAGVEIQSRYKSANTAEAIGTSLQIVAFDPNDATDLGLTNIATATPSAIDVAVMVDAVGA